MKGVLWNDADKKVNFAVTVHGFEVSPYPVVCASQPPLTSWPNLQFLLSVVFFVYYWHKFLSIGVILI